MIAGQSTFAHPSPRTIEQPAITRRGTARWLALAAVVWILGTLAMAISAWTHPLYPPDEGRYSSASVRMAEGGSWLIPVLDGQAHLNKPPLTYWAQATCLRIFGHTEAAVRMPSLIASSLLLMVLIWFGWTIASPRVGVLAGAVLSITPLHLVVGWLAITDPMLNLFWFSALAVGFLAVRSDNVKWAALMWVSVALGLFTKGPLGLMPVALLAIWQALGRESHMIRRLRIPMGFPLALVPLGIWVALVIRSHPEAAKIWYQQMIGRALGTGDHNEPFWYYVPIFVVGLLPSTAMMVLPGWNIPWREAMAKCRAADPSCLWALAVLLPLLIFSLMSGKLATYLLPLCAPTALLTAFTLERWLTGEADRAAPGTRPPEVVVASLICTAIIALVGLSLGIYLDWKLAWLAIPLAFPFAACSRMWLIWKKQPERRARALALSWLASIIACGWVLVLGNGIRAPHTARQFVQFLRATTGQQQLQILTYGLRDRTVEFYNGTELMPVESSNDALSPLQDHPEQIVMIVDTADLDQLRAKCPECANQYTTMAVFDYYRFFWLDSKLMLMHRVRDTD